EKCARHLPMLARGAEIALGLCHVAKQYTRFGVAVLGALAGGAEDLAEDLLAFRGRAVADAALRQREIKARQLVVGAVRLGGTHLILQVRARRNRQSRDGRDLAALGCMRPRGLPPFQQNEREHEDNNRTDQAPDDHWMLRERAGGHALLRRIAPNLNASSPSG